MSSLRLSKTFARSRLSPIDAARLERCDTMSCCCRVAWAYIKFVRLAERHLENACGVVGYITNNTYADAITLRGFRWHLLHTFDCVKILNLHGDADRKDVAPDGSPDQNVFEIKKGVAVALWVRSRPNGSDRRPVLGRLYLADLRGDSDSKLMWLGIHGGESTEWVGVEPREPNYFFVVQDEATADEYAAGISMADLMPEHATGFTSGYDEVLTGFTAEELVEKLREFGASREDEVRSRFKVSGVFAERTFARRDVIANDDRIRERIRAFDFTPFDSRFAYYRPDMLMTASQRVGQHLEGEGNLALMLMRQVSIGGKFSHAFVTRRLPNNRAFYSTKGKVAFFPLKLVTGASEMRFGQDIRPNFDSKLLSVLEPALSVGAEPDSPESILAYCYSILFSQRYRDRYDRFLRTGYPRIPIPREAAVAKSLMLLGRELIRLHTMESNALDEEGSTYVGEARPVVGRISWSKNTVWLDKAQTTGFKGVREDVWNFHIGGYQVCEKWLKDRKGRTLSTHDIARYQKIVVALAETIRVMKEIDEVIEQHGGWPGAFRTGEAKASTATVIPFRPRTVEPKPGDRYVTCVPLIPLKAAAGAFGDPQHIEDDGFEWVAVESRHRLRPGMFVAQVVGKSMQPAIPDGAYSLFRAPVEGTRQGKTVLLQLRNGTDPETGERYTVKRYRSEKAATANSWRHETITLEPLNTDFEPIILTGADEGAVQVIAELVEVLEARDPSESS